MRYKIVHIQATFHQGRPLYSLLAAKENADGSYMTEDTIQKQTRDLGQLGFDQLADLGCTVDHNFQKQS